MMDKDAKELVSEIKKIRGDMDKIQAYIKTIAENTTPAEEPEDASGAGDGE